MQWNWLFFVMSHVGETYMSHSRALHKAVKLNQKMVILNLEMIKDSMNND